jgi:ATP-dependent exoDNAse (exonuclease V) beta subunit
MIQSHQDARLKHALFSDLSRRHIMDDFNNLNQAIEQLLDVGVTSPDIAGHFDEILQKFGLQSSDLPADYIAHLHTDFGITLHESSIEYLVETNHQLDKFLYSDLPSHPDPTVRFAGSICHHCGGTGVVHWPSGSSERCWYCDGSGVSS